MSPDLAYDAVVATATCPWHGVVLLDSIRTWRHRITFTSGAAGPPDIGELDVVTMLAAHLAPACRPTTCLWTGRAAYRVHRVRRLPITCARC